MSDFIQVSTTVADRQDAERVAGLALEKRLAACVQVIGPIRSRYRWRGHAFCDHPDQCAPYLHLLGRDGSVFAQAFRLRDQSVTTLKKGSNVACSQGYFTYFRRS